MNADAVRVTAGQQGGARSRTDGLRHVEVAKDAALRCQAIEVWSLKAFSAEDPYVRIALVVREDDDDIGERRGRGVSGEIEATEKKKERDQETIVAGNDWTKARPS